MYKSRVQDTYTSLPIRARSKFRRYEPQCQPIVHEAIELVRERLLESLSATIVRGREKIQVLVDTLDMDVSLDLSLARSVEARQASDSTPDATDSFRGGYWNPGDIVNKNDYLLTPIRKRFFPKASPSVLKHLLSTPSLRISTPDFSGQLSDTLQSDSSQQTGGATTTTQSAFDPPEPTSPLPFRSAEVTPFQPSDSIPFLASHSLPPSPPQSTELPSAAFPPCSDFEVESSPPTQVSGTLLAIPSSNPYEAPRRSSHVHSHHDLFPDVITSSLRASPCSPLVTRSGGGEGMPPESSPYHRPRHCRPSDPRLLMHNHLAFGVVRSFQRVLDELQGLGPREADRECTESAYEEVALLPPSSSPPREPSPSPEPTQKQAIARSQAAESLIATSSGGNGTISPARLLPSLGPNLEDGSAHIQDKLRTLDFSSWERPLDLGGCDSPRLAADLGSGHGTCRLRATSSFSGLQDEFVTLLSDQASEEEEHARRLRKMAEELEKLARCKRHLAEVVTKKRL